MQNFFHSRRGAIFIVVLFAFMVRLWAAVQLPGDYDEPVYLENAFDYSRLLRAGDLNGIIDYPKVTEHPPLTRLIYAGVITLLGPRGGYSDALLFSRFVSVVLGTLAVWMVAIIDPAGGALFALQTYAVKYTSQAYLEALPLFASLAALLTLRLSSKKHDRWFWLSAAALGLAAAGKFSYFPIAIVILYIFFFEKKYRWRDLLLYIALGLVVFIALDPALWRDPINRLWSSLFFHTQYSQSAHVELSPYSRWYQPLLWLSRSYPYQWHPGVFFYNPLEGLFSVDGIIFMLALAGVFLEGRKQRWIVIWMVSGVIFLILWPTKWPQYTLVVIPAFCLAGGITLRRIWNWAKGIEDYYQWFSSVIPKPSRLFWGALIFFTALAIISTVTNFVSLGLARRGWSHLVKDTSPLPSMQVNDLFSWGENKMAIGTSSGLVIWEGAQGDQIEDQWQVYTMANSGLPNNHILSLSAGPDGSLWVGTRDGLARFDSQSWQVYRADELGLQDDGIHEIMTDIPGQLWIGTNQGAAMFDGQKWVPYNQENTPLADELILALAVEQTPAGNLIYLGTGDGLYRLNASSGEWTRLSPERFNRQGGGVSDLLFDSQGRLWVATLGSGLSQWDGSSWRTYTLANSDLPTNRVEAIWEIAPNNLWVATSYPERPGGFVSQFDGQDWRTYRGIYSGYSGASASAFAVDREKRIWIATLTSGVDIFIPGK